eukprot:scaffold11462_cov140-Isochrysis_galbana.AAC.7
MAPVYHPTSVQTGRSRRAKTPLPRCPEGWITTSRSSDRPGSSTVLVVAYSSPILHMRRSAQPNDATARNGATTPTVGVTTPAASTMPAINIATAAPTGRGGVLSTFRGPFKDSSEIGKFYSYGPWYPSAECCGSMIVPWGAFGPRTAVGVCKPPHAPERGMGRPPRDTPLRQRC